MFSIWYYNFFIKNNISYQQTSAFTHTCALNQRDGERKKVFYKNIEEKFSTTVPEFRPNLPFVARG